MKKTEVILKINQWCSQLNLIANAFDDPNADLNIAITHKGIPPVNIIKPLQGEYLVFLSRVAVGDQHKEVLTKMNKEKRDFFYLNLKLDLLKLNIDFSALPAEPFPVTFEISTVLFTNAINFQNIYEKYTKIKTASLYIAWSMGKLLISTKNLLNENKTT